MKIYVCPICGETLMPHPEIYTYKQPVAGQLIPCTNCSPYNPLKWVLPLATPQETLDEGEKNETHSNKA